MQRKIISLVFLLSISVLPAIIPGCKTEKEPVVESDTSPPVDASDILETVGTKLGDDVAGMPADIQSTLKSYASKEVNDQNLTDSRDLAAVAAAISLGFMKGLGNYGDDQLSDQPNSDNTVQSPNKKLAIESIGKRLAEILHGELTGDDLAEAVNKLFSTIVSNLSTAGLAKDDYLQVTEFLIDGVMTHLTNLGCKKSDLIGISKELLETSIGGLGTIANGLDETARYDALYSCLQVVLEGLKEGVNPEEYNEAATELAKIASTQAVANEIAWGKDDEKLKNSIDDITLQIMGAMDSAGTSTVVCANAAADIISAAAEELSPVLSADDLSQALSGGIDGIKEGLIAAEASVAELNSAEEAAGQAADNAVTEVANSNAVKLIISDEKLQTEEQSDENGSFKVSLDKAPSNPVSVKITSNDITEGKVGSAKISFTAENWNVPELVIIMPQDDLLVDEEVSYSIILETTEGARKTLVVKNADNDHVGIDVTPKSDQYSSEVGGEVHFEVRLTSQPKSPIKLRWGIESGGDAIKFPDQYRVMIFPVKHEGASQKLILIGKECEECMDKKPVTIKAINIFSENKLDPDYEKLQGQPVVSFKHLKGGPIIKKTDFKKQSGFVEVNFDSSKLDFTKTDEEYTYEAVFATESITMKYAKYQSRPLLIKESECFNGSNVDFDVVPTIEDAGEPPVPTTTYPFSFCLKFFNADLSQTRAGTSRWALDNGFSRDSCYAIESDPRYIKCKFSGISQVLPSTEIPPNTIFSSDKIGNVRMYLTANTDDPVSKPDIPALPDTDRPTVQCNYERESIAGTNRASFNPETELKAGYWYLSNKSKSYVLGGDTYTSSNYLYIQVPE